MHSFLDKNSWSFLFLNVTSSGNVALQLSLCNVYGYRPLLCSSLSQTNQMRIHDRFGFAAKFALQENQLDFLTPRLFIEPKSNFGSARVHSSLLQSCLGRWKSLSWYRVSVAQCAGVENLKWQPSCIMPRWTILSCHGR